MWCAHKHMERTVELNIEMLGPSSSAHEYFLKQDGRVEAGKAVSNTHRTELADQGAWVASRRLKSCPQGSPINQKLKGWSWGCKFSDQWILCWLRLSPLPPSSFFTFLETQDEKEKKIQKLFLGTTKSNHDTELVHEVCGQWSQKYGLSLGSSGMKPGVRPDDSYRSICTSDIPWYYDSVKSHT